MPRNNDLEKLLGALEQVVQGANRAARQDPGEAMLTMVESISRAVDRVAGQGARPPRPSAGQANPVDTARVTVAQELVRRAFQQVLGRPPNADELHRFSLRVALPLKNSGASDDEVVTMLLRALEGHPEVQARTRPAPAPPPPPPPPPSPRAAPTPPPAPTPVAPPAGDRRGGRRLNIRKRDA